MLARSLGISEMVVVMNKMDEIDWKEDRYKTVKD